MTAATIGQNHVSALNLDHPAFTPSPIVILRSKYCTNTRMDGIYI
jgi:hypothetical protein